MDYKEAINIIKKEAECVNRQGKTGECCRDDLGCGACDLSMNDIQIFSAYFLAIEALKKNDDTLGRWIPYKVSFDGETLIKAEISDPNQTERFEIYDDLFLCSRCKKESFESEYCPHCGQRMEPVNYD